MFTTMKKILFSLILLILMSSRTWAAVALVNQSTATSGASSVTTQTTGAISTSTGNLIVVIVATQYNSLVTGITDTAGNTYHQAASAYAHDTGNNVDVDIWYAYNITGNAANNATVTVSPATTFLTPTQIQISGASTSSSVFEVAATGTSDSSATTTSGSFSPALSGNFNAVISNMNCGNTYTAGTNYTALVSGSQGEYWAGATAGSQTAIINNSNSGCHSVISVASFQATGGGTGSTLTTIGNSKIGNVQNL